MSGFHVVSKLKRMIVGFRPPRVLFFLDDDRVHNLVARKQLRRAFSMGINNPNLFEIFSSHCLNVKVCKLLILPPKLFQFSLAGEEGGGGAVGCIIIRRELRVKLRMNPHCDLGYCEIFYTQ